MQNLNIARLIVLTGLTLSLNACKRPPSTLGFTVHNPGPDRRAETISIPASTIESLTGAYGADNVFVVYQDSVLVSQAVDHSGDGKVDEILFQTDLRAGEDKHFTLQASKDGAARRPKSPVTTYSRFVPERIDDYAWENDRVAFRTYGPEAQRITESGKPGGTLTSGMDCWLKRVSHPVVDSWYRKAVTQSGYYHKDHGEGYDPYHVGDSRGCGGIGVWENDSLYTSKNFVRYKTLAEGPIRTLFELEYEPWTANGKTVHEKKIISLDLGSNLTRYEVDLTGSDALPNVAIGITLHDNKGDVKRDSVSGWFRYYEQIDSIGLGTGVVIRPQHLIASMDRRVKVKDQSQILVLTDARSNRVVYYAGFGWEKSGQFSSPAEWDKYLENFAACLAAPVEIKFNVHDDAKK